MISEIDSNGRLYWKGDPELWIGSNPADRLRVRRLVLDFWGKGEQEKIVDSIGELSELTELFISHGEYLKCLPNTITRLTKLQSLNLDSCDGVEELPANLGELKSLRHLRVSSCIQSFPLFAGLRNIQKLHLHDPSLKSLPNLDEMSQLLLVHISGTDIRCLPWSITNLPNLRILFLPWNFRLETLPWHLNDSIILVKQWHDAKTWKEVKTEMELWSFPLLQAQLPSSISPMRLGEDSGLDLDLSDNDAEDLSNSIGNLSELTHLYIYGSAKLKHLPDTLTKLKHLSFDLCNLHHLSDSLVKLSYLQSLHLDVESEEDLPSNMNLLVGLRRLSIGCIDAGALPNSMAKLTNLKALELDGFQLESLPPILNLSKLKLIDTTVSSFPTCLTHLEITHTLDYYHLCDGILGLNINHLVNLEKLSILWDKLKSLPSIAGLYRLQILQLRNCFSLKTLPPDIHELVNLCTLDIKGTRIKSLPNSISKLLNLRHLFLPKCFKEDSLPSSLRERSIVVKPDDADELYYEETRYYDTEYDTSTEVSDEDTALSAGSIGEEVNEVDSRESRQGFMDVHTTPSLSDAAALVSLDSHVTGREDPTGENNNNVFCLTQNPEPVGNQVSNPYVTDFSGQSSQHTLQGSLGFISSQNEHVAPQLHQQIYPCDARNPLDRSNNCHTLGNEQINENMQRKSAQRKGKEIEITREAIMSFFPRNMTLLEAANELKVSRSTLKRKLKKFNIEWQSSRHAKKKQITKSHSRSNASLVNLMISPEPAGHEQCMEGFNVANQQTISDQVPYQRNDINNSTSNVTQITVEGPAVTIQVHTDGADQSALSIIRKHLGLSLGGESQQVVGSEGGEEEGTEERFNVSNHRTLSDHVSSQCNDFNNSTGVHADDHELGREFLDGVHQSALSFIEKHLCLILSKGGESQQVVGSEGGKEEGKEERFNVSNHRTLSDHVPSQCNDFNNSTQVHADGHGLGREFLHGADQCTLSNINNESTSSCIIRVKATYKGQTVRFRLSRVNVYELKKQVAENLELKMELEKFKMTYQDEEQDWVLMTKNEQLEEALDLLKSSDSNILRLQVIDSQN